MAAVVVVGAQWGDEGKGKLVDVWAGYSSAVVRYAGGANAGHTLVVEGERRVFHLIPSGALHERIGCVIGQGTVVDPEVLVGELEWLRGRGLLPEGRLVISDRAHVVLPHHKLIDGLRESGDAGIGTTKRGIGPAYEDKAGRRGVRIGDLLRPGTLRARVEANLSAWSPVIRSLGGEPPDAGEIARAYADFGVTLAPHVGDASAHVTGALERGDKVLLEGAQGTLLDIDHGTYPFVTSSSAVAGGACAGAGVGPASVDRVIGITKAYTTRVGGGPFPTELMDATGDHLRKAGHEFGATTGRPRRCGWLDAVGLRFAVRVNGMEQLALTKLDVLSGLPELRIAVAYERDGERLETLPFDELERVEPVYERLEGFSEDISGCQSRDELPAAARRYIARLEELVGCPVGVVSVGPDRRQTLGITDPFGAR